MKRSMLSRLSSRGSRAHGRTVAAIAAVVAGSALVACSSLLGLTDPRTDDGALADGALADGGGGGTVDGTFPGDDGGGGDDGSTADGTSPGDGSGGDASCAPGADFTGDKANCGRCGHSCLGGDCTGSVCQAVPLAVAQSNPFGIAVQGTRVYWTTFGGNTVIMADKADGKNAAPVAKTGIASPWGIITDDTFVYWANHDISNGTIAKCPLAGCGAAAPTVLAAGRDEPTGLALAGARLFYTESSGGNVWAANASDGGASVNLTPGGINQPFKLVTDGAYVYFTSNENLLHSVKATGGPVVDLVNAVDNSGIALDQGTLFFTIVPQAGNSGSVLTVSKDGGVSTGYAGSQTNPLNVVVDANYVYWTNNGTVNTPAQPNDLKDGSVVACARPGPCTKPIVLATNQHAASGITIDADAVYWTNAGVGGLGNGDGSVMKIAKP